MKKISIYVVGIMMTFGVSSCDKAGLVKEMVSNDKTEVAKEQIRMDKNNPTSCSVDQNYYNEHVSFYDARVRSINQQKYVKEVLFVDHGKSGSLCERIGFKGMQMSDNGRGFDKVAGDGVYTSSKLFQHNEANPFEEIGKLKSVMNRPVVNESFMEHANLQAYNNLYIVRDNFGGGEDEIFQIQCDVTFGGNDCYAAEWGWCSDCCITIDTNSCNITVGL